MAKPIGTLGTIDTLTVGGQVFTDLTTIIGLVAFSNTNTNGSFRVPFAAAARVVTSAKTFTVNAVKVWTNSTAQLTQFKLAYSDNDVGMDTATALTNGVYYMTTSVGATMGAQLGLAPNNPAEFGFMMAAVPAGKYITAVFTNQGHAMLWGYEV